MGRRSRKVDIGSSQLAKTQEDRSLTFFRERASSISVRADVWDRAINGMLTAQQRLVRAALPHLRKSDGATNRISASACNLDRSAATVDLPLLKAVARAHRSFDEISTGKASSLAALWR
jgi:hypothetical protein